MHPVSAVVLTKNEEVMLPACLAALAWADERLVVDSYSTDRTRELARAAGARVLEHPFEGFAAKLGWAFSQAAHPWILLVDADEIVDDKLQAAVRAVLAGEPAHEIYNVVRDSFFLGRRMRATSWSGEVIPRLFRRGALSFTGAVHPKPDTGGRAVGRLDGRLLHYTYRSLEQYFQKQQFYSTLWAEQAKADGKRVGLPAIFLSPAWRFFHNYFLRGEILDGRIGLLTAGLSSMYTFVKYVKLWGLNRGD